MPPRVGIREKTVLPFTGCCALQRHVDGIDAFGPTVVVEEEDVLAGNGKSRRRPREKPKGLVHGRAGTSRSTRPKPTEDQRHREIPGGQCSPVCIDNNIEIEVAISTVDFTPIPYKTSVIITIRTF